MKAFKILVATCLLALAMGTPNAGRALTNKLYLTQGLFDNVSQNFIHGALEGLQNKTIGFEVINGTFPKQPLEGISVLYNLTNLNISEAEVDAYTPIISIQPNNTALLQFNDLNLNFTWDYAYIFNPPILADIGSAFAAIKSLSFEVKWNSTFNSTEGIVQLGLNDLHLEVKDPQPFVAFDGLADYS
jgi:hypothetical protein